MNHELFWAIAALIAWLIFAAFFIFSMLPAIFELKTAIRKLRNKVARWITGS